MSSSDQAPTSAGALDGYSDFIAGTFAVTLIGSIAD